MPVLCMIYLAWCSSLASAASSQVGKPWCPQPSRCQGCTEHPLSPLLAHEREEKASRILVCFVLVVWVFFSWAFLYSSEYLQKFFFPFSLFPPDGLLLKITSKPRKTHMKKGFLSQTVGQHIHLSSLHEALAVKDVIFPLYLGCSITTDSGWAYTADLP